MYRPIGGWHLLTRLRRFFHVLTNLHQACNFTHVETGEEGVTYRLDLLYCSCGKQFHRSEFGTPLMPSSDDVIKAWINGKAYGG